MFKGSIVAIITPFNEDQTINFSKFVELIQWHLTQNTDGIVVCGTTGESATLSDDEKLQLFSLAVKTVNKKIPIIAGCGSNDTCHSLNLSKQACALGVDGLLLINPYYNKSNNEGLYQHFAKVAEAVNIPIMLYNVPSRTSAVIPYEVIKRLVNDFSHICALKDASGDINYALKCGKLLTLFSGDDNSIVALMAIGAQGVVSVAANVIPQIIHDICDNMLKQNYQQALVLQREYQELIEMLFIEVNPIPVKYAMNLMNMNVGGYRLPLMPLNEQNKQRLAGIFK